MKCLIQIKKRMNKEDLKKSLIEKRIIDPNKTKDELLDMYGLHERMHTGFDKVVALKENEFVILVHNDNGWKFWNTEDIGYEQYMVLKSIYDVEITEVTPEWFFDSVISAIEDTELVDNICLSYRHDFGLLSDDEKNRVRQDCKRWAKAIKDNQ